MPFKVIKGTFHVNGYAPDGDSIRFKAHNYKLWGDLYGKPVKLNQHCHAQLRIESIDTLETHFQSRHQPLAQANAATDRLLTLLGISNVVWNRKHNKIISADDGVPGYIITRRTERNARPISFVFDNSHQFKDGDDLFVSKAIAKKSVNYQMLKTGFAYPTFYDGLFYDLREVFAEAAIAARKSRLGIWSQDKTNSFIHVEQMADITDKYVLLPKLFRRLLMHVKANNGLKVREFIEELKQAQEKVFILNRLHFTHLHSLIRIDKTGKMRFTERPENIIFIA